ncbi:Rho-related GTP-binding protein RhoE [Bagarius yarrelli]|uniref:RING-type E3 ubiquitin transferase n=1 Tax=Bagarius yarrelli TaxID=175774 RepID=A0A556VW91_BAGYA|nr:Rho-related GTP-binding protein RhoE [Bagarius yarrelli]
MSVVVDHRKLPGGEDTLLSLHKNVPGVHLSYDLQKELYTLKGRYSPVQTLSCMILGTLDKQEQNSADKPQPMTGSTTAYNSLLPPVESASRQVGASKDNWAEKHTSRSETDLTSEDKSWKTGLTLPGSSSNYTPHATSAKNKWDSDIESLFEDFSLVVDSDIFHYLHKYCSKEYQSILRQHKVEVVDVNFDDITALYLKPKAALSSNDMSSVIKAHEDLVDLYQQKQSQLRKEHVYKPGIPEKELTQALESLQKKLPKLMIHEDDRSVFMIGSKSDVSEAKQFISDMQRFDMEKETKSDLFTPSHSKWTFSKQEIASSQDLFMPKKDLQDGNQPWKTSETFSKNGQNFVKLKTVDETIKKRTDSVFDFKPPEVSQDKHAPNDLEWIETGCWLDKNKHTDSLFDSSKTSASPSVMDIDERLFSKSHFISETQLKSSKGYKTKQTETGRERRMAASFSREIYSGFKDFKSEAPKTYKSSYVSESKIADNEKPHSLPIIKPSLNSNLDSNALRSGVSALTSTGKMDIQEDKGDQILKFPYDNKKPTITSARLSEKQESKGFPTVPSESTLTRSNSFSGRTKKVEEPTQMAIDVSAGQKVSPQNCERREIVSKNLVLSFRLWLYLTSVYKAEIENLTLDLQVKENLDKENIVLCLKGLNSDKVHDCYSGLKSLIATAEMDFDARTLPLSKFGVSDSKDKILIELCMLLKQHFQLVKILVMSKDVMIFGPKPLCDNVEDTMNRVFHEQETNSKVENKLSPKPDSLHTSKLLGDQPTTSAKPHTDISVNELSKTSDQSVPQSLKMSEFLTNQTKHSKEQDERSGRQNKKKEEKLKQNDMKDATLLQSNAGGVNVDSTSTQNKADSRTLKDRIDTTAQSKKTLIEQKTTDISMNQIRDPQRTHESLEPKNGMMPFHTSRNQSHLSCNECEKQHSPVKQAACGFTRYAECEDVQNNCKLCEAAGIKGTMTVQESTITIPGFHRDTTLRIIYDIPDGIQADHHPCPGAPFKGNRFEAFLPHNKTTARILPLLEKAFYTGLTFTVKGSSLARQIGAAAYAECTSKQSEDSVRDVFHVATVTSVGYSTQRLKRSGSGRGLKRTSQNPQRSAVLEPRKERAKSCTLM